MPSKDRGLFAVEHALHHRAQGHLGLAHAHVAAEQTVHRHGGFHVALDLLGAFELVLGLGIGEVLLELALPLAVRREGEARQALPLGVKADELARHALGGAARARAGAGPLGPAHLREAHLPVLAAAGVLRHQIQLRGGDVETVRPGVAYFDVVLFKAVHRHLHDAGEAADAVVLVHDVVAHGQVGVAFDARAARRQGLVRAALFLPAQQLRVGEHAQADAGVVHARGDRADGDAAAPRLGQRGQGNLKRRVDPALEKEVPQQLRAALVPREDDDAVVLPQIGRDVLGRGLRVARVARQLPGGDARERARRERAAPHGEGVGHVDGEIPEPLREGLEAQKKALGRGGGLAAARQLLNVGAQLRAPVPRLFGAAPGLVEKDERVGRKVVRGAGEGIDELQILVRAA